MDYGVYIFRSDFSYEYKNRVLYSGSGFYNSFIDGYVICNAASWSLNSYERTIEVFEVNYDVPELLKAISKKEEIKRSFNNSKMKYRIEYVNENEMKLRHKEYSIVLKRIG